MCGSQNAIIAYKFFPIQKYEQLSMGESICLNSRGCLQLQQVSPTFGLGNALFFVMSFMQYILTLLITISAYSHSSLFAYDFT